MKNTGTTGFRIGFLTVVCLLTLVLGSRTEAQIVDTPYYTPVVHTMAAAGPPGTGAEDFDVTMTPTEPPVPMNVVSTSQGNGAKASAQATANLNDRRGFRAATSAISPSYADSAISRSHVVMDLDTYDPLGRERVKLVFEFDAIADAGAPVIRNLSEPDGPASESVFVIELGTLEAPGVIARLPNGAEYITMPKIRPPSLLRVLGTHSKRFVQYNTEIESRSGLSIFGNGQEIETTSGSGPLLARKKITLNAPAGAINMIKITAYVGINGFTYVDPVVTPHPDNPEVVVTLRGAIDPNPPSLSLLPLEELVAAGIDLAPLQELDLLDSPSSLAFLSPLPEASYKVGATIKTKFRLVDASGLSIPDAEAKSLVKACRVKVGLDTTSRCAHYNAKHDFFLASVKIPKSTSVGTHEVVAQVLESDGTEADSATTAITIY